MKARIISKTYYVAEAEDGKTYSVDIKNSAIKNAFKNNLEINGDIITTEIQDKFGDNYERSYTVRERFVPVIEKITLGNNSFDKNYIPKERSVKIDKKKDYIPLPKMNNN